MVPRSARRGDDNAGAPVAAACGRRPGVCQSAGRRPGRVDPGGGRRRRPRRHRPREPGVRSFVSAQVSENGLEYRVAFADRRVLLRLVGKIGRRFLECAVASHLSAGSKGEAPRLREQLIFERSKLGVRAQAGARQVLAQDQPMLGFFVGPAGMKPRGAEHRAREQHPASAVVRKVQLLGAKGFDAHRLLLAVLRRIELVPRHIVEHTPAPLALGILEKLKVDTVYLFLNSRRSGHSRLYLSSFHRLAAPVVKALTGRRDASTLLRACVTPGAHARRGT